MGRPRFSPGSSPPLSDRRRGSGLHEGPLAFEGGRSDRRGQRPGRAPVVAGLEYAPAWALSVPALPSRTPGASLHVAPRSGLLAAQWAPSFPWRTPSYSLKHVRRCTRCLPRLAAAGPACRCRRHASLQVGPALWCQRGRCNAGDAGAGSEWHRGAPVHLSRTFFATRVLTVDNCCAKLTAVATMEPPSSMQAHWLPPRTTHNCCSGRPYSEKKITSQTHLAASSTACGFAIVRFNVSPPRSPSIKMHSN
jgi:hypothetical protein